MQETLRETNRMAIGAALVLALGGVSGLAFAGWLRFGADIMLALGETGARWCF